MGPGHATLGSNHSCSTGSTTGNEGSISPSINEIGGHVIPLDILGCNMILYCTAAIAVALTFYRGVHTLVSRPYFDDV